MPQERGEELIMGLYKRGNIWWFMKQYKGKRIVESLGTDNKRLAERVYAKKLVAIISGEYFEKQHESVTFRELTEKYMSKYEKQRDSYTKKHLLPFFGDLKLSEITAEIVEDYVIAREDENAKPSTVYQEFSLGRRMFNVARRRWKWIAHNPFSDVEFSELMEIDNSRDRWLTIEEEYLLLAHASPDYLKDVIIFAIHTGCRRGEILSLNWRQHVDMQTRVITIQASKGGNRKTIPMSETLYQMLLRRSKVRDINGMVFPVEMTAMKDAFERTVKRAKIDNLHFHDLRHTFATRLIQAGVDLYTVSKLLGHKTIRMTERYAHHYSESLRPSINALDECYNSTTVGVSGGLPNAGKSSKIAVGSA